MTCASGEPPETCALRSQVRARWFLITCGAHSPTFPTLHLYLCRSCFASSLPLPSRSLCLSPFLFSEQHMEYSEQQASSNVITMCHTKPVLTAGGTGGPSTACGVRRKVLNPGAVGAVRGLASLPRRTLPLELPLSVARGGGNHCMSTCCTRRECSERASARPRASELASERLLGNRW